VDEDQVCELAGRMAGWKDRRTMPESVDPGFKPVATGWKTGIEKPPV
jgi:hypothetical protein